VNHFHQSNHFRFQYLTIALQIFLPQDFLDIFFEILVGCIIISDRNLKKRKDRNNPTDKFFCKIRWVVSIRWKKIFFSW
jgi:hypothetical protein